MRWTCSEALLDIFYTKRKRAREGPCNICGHGGRLSWDHVPPKGGIELQAVEIRQLQEDCFPALAARRPEISQNGPAFRTICAGCNSRLGSGYDPALNELAKTVGRFLRSPLELPPILWIETRPTAVVRAVLGHLLAARLSAEDEFFDKIARALVLDPEKEVPDAISVHYWLFPYAQQLVLRNGVMPAARGRFTSFQQFGLLKYFPVAFLATTAPTYEGLDSLTFWRSKPASFTTKIRVDLRSARAPDWPEAPGEGNFLFGGRDLMESVRAQPRPSKLSRKPRRSQ